MLQLKVPLQTLQTTQGHTNISNTHYTLTSHKIWEKIDCDRIWGCSYERSFHMYSESFNYEKHNSERIWGFNYEKCNSERMLGCDYETLTREDMGL